LPRTSLLNENREIDSGRYPNFAELAGTSTWYRNTTALHFSTWVAIPSILTGSDFFAYTRRLELGALSGKLDRRRLPSNLFSLFEDTHRIIAMESFTDLAPLHSAVPDYRPSLTQRFPGLLLDASILYGHIAAPAPLENRLPALYGGWQDFASSEDAEAGGSDWPYLGKKAEEVRHFIGLLLPPSQPTLYFVHFSLPHFPFTYNQVGQSHEDGFHIPDARFRKATGKPAWASETVADLAYQAHLLQLSFTDELLGRIVERLKELTLFDESLIVITSDHGTSFYWDEDGLPAEELARVQASDTLYVPLIIKAPHQTKESIIDRPVQLLDVLPTIADMLDVEIPWVVDGISAQIGTPTKRAIVAYLTDQTQKREFDSLASAADHSLRRKLETFGAGDIGSLYAYGPHKQVVGQPIEAFPSRTSAATVTLTNSGRYRSVDPTASRLPAYVKGEIRDHSPANGNIDVVVAIAINGVIASTTTTTPLPVGTLVRNPEKSPEDDGVRYFLSRVPPEAFTAGENAVTVHGIEEQGAGRPISLIHFLLK
jgi:hypothetical protein